MPVGVPSASTYPRWTSARLATWLIFDVAVHWCECLRIAIFAVELQIIACFTTCPCSVCCLLLNVLHHFLATEFSLHKESCAFCCYSSLKNTLFLQFLLDPSKIFVQFFVTFEVLLKQNCLHLVCYAAVFLLWFSCIVFGMSLCFHEYFYNKCCDVKIIFLVRIFCTLQLAAQDVFWHQFALSNIPNTVFTCESSYCFQRVLAIAILSVRLSVCLFVRPSHRWISQKWCKLELPNFHCRLP